jgi:hypothetical protein
MELGFISTVPDSLKTNPASNRQAASLRHSQAGNELINRFAGLSSCRNANPGAETKR